MKHKSGPPDNLHKHRDLKCLVCDTPMKVYCDVVCRTVVESPASSKNDSFDGNLNGNFSSFPNFKGNTVATGLSVNSCVNTFGIRSAVVASDCRLLSAEGPKETIVGKVNTTHVKGSNSTSDVVHEECVITPGCLSNCDNWID